MNIIDLHVHSLVSDGSYTPHDLACHAKEVGLSAPAKKEIRPAFCGRDIT